MPVFIYVCMSVCVCVCMHAALSSCVNACVCMHVSFESIRVRVSYMCLHVLNLTGPRLPEAGFLIIINLLINTTSLSPFYERFSIILSTQTIELTRIRSVK